MSAQRLFLATIRPIPVGRGGRWLLLGLLMGLLLAPEAVLAQRPYLISDPFYRSEAARRDFFDQYAITGEVLYRSAGVLQEDGVPASNSDLDFRFRFDYKLASRIDLGAILEATGGAAGRRLSVSWVVLKYYRYLEQANYAFRLAVDPSSDGRVGFPQVDIAFLYTSLHSPILSSDFAMGMRRVHLGYAQISPPEPLEEGPYVVKPPPATIIFTRALGTELHVMLNYNLHFDPAGSNFFAGLLGEGGSYNLIEAPLAQGGVGAGLANLELAEGAQEKDREVETPYRGGVVWVRGGVEFKRPSYEVSPFLSAPLTQWTRDDDAGNWPRARLQFGVRLMLR